MTYFSLFNRVFFLANYYAHNYYFELMFHAPIGNYNSFKKIDYFLTISHVVLIYYYNNGQL